ncbi:hypothetical protein BC831DRAFT_236294 [Entophlyctis helioformis]|nr:hypothetical protein BC831DRAFT_236294 [Entophlyctis helioformis]
MDAVAKATAKATQEADEQGLVGKEREEHIKAAIDAVRPAKRTKAILTGSIRTDGNSIFQLALNGRTDRPESPCCQQPWVDDDDDSDDDDDGHDGHDHMDGTSTKPKATNPAQRNFYASQRLLNIVKANKLFTNKGYRFVRIVGIDWGQRYMYGASSMLVDLRDFSYTLEANYVLSSGMAHAERIFQDWFADRLAKAADIQAAIAFKTAKHADPNVKPGERAFWDLRCRAYCSPFLNARKVKAKRFTMRSNSTSIRGNALEGIMKLAGSTTGKRASAASQGRCDKPTEKDIPVVGHLASTLQAKVAGTLCLRSFSSGICGRLDMPISTAATRT